MKEEKKLFTVIITDDYNDNPGNPVSCETKTFEKEEEATSFFEKELLEITNECGIIRRVEKFEGVEENLLLEQKEIDICESQLLPKNAVLVFFRHKTYMNYCYEILNVREKYFDEKYYSDMPFSNDSTHATWVCVLENIDELKDAYENAYSQPFDKINSGSYKIKEFLKENNVEGYCVEVIEE